MYLYIIACKGISVTYPRTYVSYVRNQMVNKLFCTAYALGVILNKYRIVIETMDNIVVCVCVSQNNILYLQTVSITCEQLVRAVYVS